MFLKMSTLRTHHKLAHVVFRAARSAYTAVQEPAVIAAVRDPGQEGAALVPGLRGEWCPLSSPLLVLPRG